MKHTDAHNNVAGQFVEEDVNTGRLPTVIDASIMNNIVNEMCYIVEDTGGTLDGNDHTQVWTQIKNYLQANNIAFSVTMNNVPGALIDINVMAKVPYSVKEFDTHEAFNLSDLRFTAPSQGVYLFYQQVQTEGCPQSLSIVTALYKNGVEYRRTSGAQVSGIGGSVPPGLVLAYLNAGAIIEFYYSFIGVDAVQHRLSGHKTTINAFGFKLF